MGDLPCDILVSVHPEQSDLWTRLAARTHGDADALIDRGACKRYAENARAALAKRVAAEKAK
jgi:metallo-beta-lactamase class B